MAELILFTKEQKLSELSLLGKAIYLMMGSEPEEHEFNTNIVLPEDLLVRTVVKLSSISLSTRITNESDAVDDMFGSYPFVLLKHYFITSRNILPFVTKMTSLNQHLTLHENSRRSHLEDLLTHKLHLISKLAFHEQRLGERNTLFFALFHPWTYLNSLH